MLGEFENVVQLSRTRAGGVYTASDVRTGRAVILKIVTDRAASPKAASALAHEHQLLLALGPALRGGFPQPVELSVHEGALVLVLEDIGARSLADHLAASPGGLPVQNFLPIASRLTRLLCALHEQGIIHRDINPSNVTWCPESGAVQIVDLGISTRTCAEHQSVNVTDRLRGSLPYISPEQSGRMNRDIDYRTDLYSLGVTFYELLCGSLPLQAADALGWVHAHMTITPPDLCERSPRVPRPLADVVGHLMEKEPGRRYQSAFGLLRDLERLAAGAVVGFEPGQDDVSGRFLIPQRLYGREQDVLVLQHALLRASGGESPLVLIDGPSGIGKSSVVGALHPLVDHGEGFFIEGRFDSLQRSAPFQAVAQACASLVSQLFTRTEEEFGLFQAKIEAAVGLNGGVLTELVPGLRRVIGRQPPAAHLDAAGSRRRTLHVISAFLQVFAAPERPLVVFLDDLQWADTATLELVCALVSTHPVEHLLLVGAYRGDEVDSAHPLRALPGPIERLELRGLDAATLGQLVADTLGISEPDAAPIAQLIFERTGGSPFFSIELFKRFAAGGHIRFLHSQGRWEWDLDGMRSVEVSDDVVALMLSLLEGLPRPTQRLLGIAACIGGTFSLRALEDLSEQQSCAEILWPAVQAGLLIRLTGSDPPQLRFQHGRVQQAAADKMPAADRRSTHLRWGKLLMALDEADRSARLVEITHHWNRGLSLLEEPEERATLRNLNREAARRALAAGVYDSAAEYLEIARSLLPDDAWTVSHTETFDLYYHLAEVEIGRARHGAAEALGRELLDRASTDIQRARVHNLDSERLVLQALYQKAVDSGLRGMAALGIRVPATPRLRHVIWQSVLARINMRGRTAAQLMEAPECTDERTVLTETISKTLMGSMFLAQDILGYATVQLMAANRSLRNGISPLTPFSYASYAVTLNGPLNQKKLALEVAEVALELEERQGLLPTRGGTQMLYAAFVLPWSASLQDSVAWAERAAESALATGDLIYYQFSRSYQVTTSALFRDLESVCAMAETAQALFDSLQPTPLTRVIFTPRGLWMNLRGLTDDRLSLRTGDHDPKAYCETVLVMEGFQQGITEYHYYNMIMLLLRGAFVEAFAEGCAIDMPQLENYPEGWMSVLFRGLAGAAAWPELDRKQRRIVRSHLRIGVKKFSAWAAFCPDGFRMGLLLLRAEQARLQGRDPGTLYDEAIEAAKIREYPLIIALCCLTAARHWSGSGQAIAAQGYLGEAVRWLGRWGATDLVEELRARLPRLALRAPPPPIAIDDQSIAISHSLDIDALVKAGTAISGEVVLEHLTRRLVKIIQESAGADRVCLLLCGESGELVLTAATDGQEVQTCEILLSDCRDLSTDAALFVQRSAETLRIDDVAADRQWAGAPSLCGQGVRSLMCLPINHQGATLGVIYLENRQSSHVFTPQSEQFLSLLAGQVAISITNARLYDTLERRVADRTAQLTARSREIEAMLNSLDQGVFTLGPDLRVHPRYSRHLSELLGTDEIAGCGLDEILAHTDLAEDVRASQRMALQLSFHTSAFMAKFNNHLLARAFTLYRGDEARLVEVDWTMIENEQGVVDRVLVAIRDVTELRRSQDAARQSARQVEIITKLLDAGPRSVSRFHRGARQQLDRARQLLCVPDAASVEVIFRHIHTLKGNASMNALGYLSEAAHHTEQVLDAVRQDPRAWDPPRMRAELDALEAVLTESIQAAARLGPDYHLPEQVLDAELGVIVSELEQSLTTTAQALKKPAPAVTLRQSRRFTLTGEWVEVLQNVLVHALRNALDHGIEPPSERRRLGKPERGMIIVRAAETPGGLRVEVGDDGGGLALHRLRAALPEADQLTDASHSDPWLAEQAFAAGVSTASSLTDISGRGVGMGAIRAFLRSKGGDCSIRFTGPRVGGLRPFVLVLALPQASLVPPEVMENAG